jgi:drug/metabolite transporter (DMT)-like permease
LFAAMGVIWGIPYLLIKVADSGVSVPVLVWTRVTVGALILVPVALAQGAWRPEGRALLRRSWRWVLAYAIIEIIAPWALLSTAEHRLSSSTSGLLIASVPAIGALLAWFFGGERLSRVRAAGLGLGFAGVVLLAAPNAGRGDLLADAEVLLTAICYAAGPMIANRKLVGVPSIAANATCLVIAAVVYTPAAVLTWPHTVPSARVLASLAALGAVCTAARPAPRSSRTSTPRWRSHSAPESSASSSPRPSAWRSRLSLPDRCWPPAARRESAPRLTSGVEHSPPPRPPRLSQVQGGVGIGDHGRRRG